MIFNIKQDVRLTVESVSYILATSVNLLSLHTVQGSQAVTLDAKLFHFLGGRQHFSKDRAGFRLTATGLHHPIHPG